MGCADRCGGIAAAPRLVFPSTGKNIPRREFPTLAALGARRPRTARPGRGSSRRRRRKRKKRSISCLRRFDYGVVTLKAKSIRAAIESIAASLGHPATAGRRAQRGKGVVAKSARSPRLGGRHRPLASIVKRAVIEEPFSRC
jgi:hypothetical protein